MNFDDLSILKAKSIRQHLENRRETLLKQKELIKPLPGSKPFDKEPVNGGTREDKFLNYVITCEELDQQINYIDTMILLYDEYIKKELKRLDDYDEWEQKVIWLKESGLTYFQIAMKTPFSERTCRRIWKKYKNRRSE